ncbi:hypothetical protein ROHU_015326 [Labeo rohita]|uniref:Uncharacterized protein n=1 Tax=Labeo rohita TaxID=84645 RepID=A0A498LWY1_LABRO|nr:hypothetical protein ROHU_010493 [Labeo rohita]RXN33887.1 hypothetical protein ROHU_015326 [Labeo rohita]
MSEKQRYRLLERYGLHCCGSVEVGKRLLRERTLLRQCGSTEEAPAGVDTAAAVRKQKKGSCGSDTTAAV